MWDIIVEAAMSAGENTQPKTIKTATIKSTWGTPCRLFKKLCKRFRFDKFDPCPHPKPDFDGLDIEWAERTFLNPPYDELADWVEKAFKESRKGKLVVMLAPARMHTDYFQRYVLPHATVEFIPGRIKFADLSNDGKVDKACGFGCCLIIWDGLK